MLSGVATHPQGASDVLAFWMCCALMNAPAAVEQIPTGSATVAVTVGGQSLDLYTYRPANYTDGPLLLVFHGVLRNADDYRDHARGMGDRFRALIVAPRFPEDRFPIVSYQQGGLKLNGEVQPRNRWTWELIPQIATEVRRREGRPDLPYYLIGHSGGGQFLIRLSGFTTTDARRIVVSNPGTYLLPSREHDYPFGFGGLPDELANDAALQRHLAQPITLYLAMEDTERDEYFDQTPPAERQGATRWERGNNAYKAAHELAKARGWTCNWRLVPVPGVGHDYEKMFNHPLCREALFGPEQKPPSPVSD
jgi:pimeloyl-ACP methyl ester carboxylesterase